MTKVLVDTNIVLDLLAKREPFYSSAAQVFSLADGGKLDLSVSALTIANTDYVLSKLLSGGEARMILRRFKVLARILPLNEKIVELALNDDDFDNFEDGLQYYSALENKQEIILTRDLRGFRRVKFPVMSPGEYLASRRDFS